MSINEIPIIEYHQCPKCLAALPSDDRGFCFKCRVESNRLEYSHIVCAECGAVNHGDKDCCGECRKIMEIEEMNYDRPETSLYGKELILDLTNCVSSTFTRQRIEEFFVEICKRIDMQRGTLHWWDDVGLPPEECETEPHLKGTSAVQFIRTSNITIHTLDLMRNVYLNVFSCKDFDPETAVGCALEFFGGEVLSSHVVERKK